MREHGGSQARWEALEVEKCPRTDAQASWCEQSHGPSQHSLGPHPSAFQ